MNILLPTDFSENSKNAISYALKLLQNKKCTLYFLHAFPQAIYSYESQVSSGKFGLNLATKETQRRTNLLDNFISDLKDEFSSKNHSVYSIVVQDFISDAIKDTLKDKKIDLIVLSPKGKTSSSDVVFGSVTSYVLSKIKVPSLTIPSNYTYEPIKKILFPSDFLIKHTNKVVQPLSVFLDSNDKEVTILHCNTKELTKKQEENLTKLKELIEKDSEKIIKNDNLIEVIDEKMKEYDMLFMANNKKSFFENLFFTPTVSRVVVSLKKPFLVSHF